MHCFLNLKFSKKITLSLISVFVICPIFSQEGFPIFSDYLTENLTLIHPSAAGVASSDQLRATVRKSWIGQKDSPGLQTASYNGRVSQSSGIGVTIFNDKNGFNSQSGGYIIYAHHILFSRDETNLNMLSFGISPGIIQYRLDQTNFIIDNDLAISGGLINSTNFNIDIGVSYHLRNFFSHFTAKNMIENAGINNDTQITSNLRRYLFSLGYVFKKRNSKVLIEPSILFQHREALSQNNIDINGKIYYNLSETRTIYGGLSYRTALDKSSFTDGSRVFTEQLNYITPFIGIRVKQFKFAYTYSRQLNSVAFIPNGLHQITLGYDFNKRKERYHCDCPALN